MENTNTVNGWKNTHVEEELLMVNVIKEDINITVAKIGTMENVGIWWKIKWQIVLWLMEFGSVWKIWKIKNILNI